MLERMLMWLRETLCPPALIPVRVRRVEPRLFARLSRRPLRRRRSIRYTAPMNWPTLEHFVGNTPLVRLQRLPGATSNVILGKLEGNNPAEIGRAHV